MFFTECEHLAEQHPDLARVFEQLDSQLRAMGTAEVIRPDDLASFLNIDPNQMHSALEMFAQVGVLDRPEMIECAYCQMAALRSEYQKALDEDDEYRCTSCDRPLTDKTIQIISTYRRGEKWRAVSPTDLLRDHKARAPKERPKTKKPVKLHGESTRKGGRPVILVDGERIKELRGESTQAAFARFCNISVDALQLAEGQGRSSNKTIRKIATILRKKGQNVKAKDLIKNTPQ